MAKSSTPAPALPVETSGSRAPLVLAVVFTIAIVAMVHWPALSARALSIDDQQYLIENPLVRAPGWNSVRRFFSEVLAPSTVEGYYHPLAMTSLMIDVALGGSPDNLMPFRRTNLLLHLANCALLVVILSRLFSKPASYASGRADGKLPQTPDYATLAATLAVLILALHPLAVEPVTWLSERKTLIAALFSLLSVLTYLRFVERGRIATLVFSFAWYVLALLSKPTSLPLPIVLLLIDWWPLKRLSVRAILEKAPFFVAAIGMAIVTYLSQANTASATLPGSNSPLRIPLIITHNIGLYITQFLWPARVSGHYIFPPTLALNQPADLRGAIISVTLLVVLVYALRSTPSLVAGFLMWFVMLLPTLQLVGFTDVIAADKYLYLPSIGVAIVLCHGIEWLLAHLSRSQRKLVVAGLALILVGEAFGSRVALAKWSDTETLYKHMLTIAPNDARVHSYLALYYSEHNRPNDAFKHCEAAMRETPADDQYPVNIGTTLARIGKPEAAAKYYQDALKRFPDSASLQANLAAVLSSLGELEQAIRHGRRAVELKPNLPAAHNNLANALLATGQLDEAVKSYEAALALRPDLSDVHNNLGVALFQMDNEEKALQEFDAAIRLRGDYADPHRNKALLLASQRKLPEAMVSCRAALSLEPKNPLNHVLMGDLMMDMGNPADARGVYLEALNLSPGLPGAERGLAGAEARLAAPQPAPGP